MKGVYDHFTLLKNTINKDYKRNLLINFRFLIFWTLQGIGFSIHVQSLFYYSGWQKEPAILISTLLLQTHAPQLYSLVLTQFCWNLESSTTNAWNAKNAIFSRTSHVTFGPWITWRSCIAAALTNPNRSYCRVVLCSMIWNK